MNPDCAASASSSLLATAPMGEGLFLTTDILYITILIATPHSHKYFALRYL